MERAFERGGYIIEHTTDSAGTNVTHVYYPHWRYNMTADQDDPGREYAGKTVILDGWFGSRSRFLGQPWFYVVGASPVNQTANSPVGRGARDIAERFRHGSTRNELPTA